MLRLESGFVYLWALFAVVLAGIVMAGTGQMWQTKSQREKEIELMFIGEEFRKAIMSYYNSGTKQYPESLENLLQDSRTPAIKRHLRKIYLDPITNTTEWGLVEEPPPGAAGPAANKNPAPSSSSNATPNKNSASSNNSLAPSSNNQASNMSGQLPNTSQTSGGQVANTNQASSNSAAPTTSSAMGSNINKRIIGVYSLSEKKPIKKDQFPEHYAKFSEALTYKDWQFVYKPGDSKAASTQSKPNAASTPGTNTSPFSPQSGSGSSKGGGASPFSPQSSSTSNSKVPTSGFPSDD